MRRIIFVLCAMTFLIVTITFFWMTQQYYSLKNNMNVIDTLHTQYMIRLHMLQEMSIPYQKFFTDNNAIATDIQTDTEFITINRSPEYLKESTYQFFKSQQLDNQFLQIDQTIWQEYNGHQIISPKKITKSLNKKKQIRYKRVTYKQRNSTAKMHAPSFTWPIEPERFWISSFFGPRRKKDGSIGFHHGIDMAAIKGTPVHAVADGVIIEAGHQVGYGKVIVIRHAQGFKTRYAHLNSLNAKIGQKVYAKKIIGYVGETGFIRKKTKDGSHLHFEICDNGRYVDPLLLLPVL